LPEKDSDIAGQLLDDFVDNRLDLIAPDLLVAELGNTLWKRCRLTKDISTLEVEDSYNDFFRLGLQIQPSSSIGAAALEFALREGHSVYDALYVVLAQGLRCRLITADRTLINKFATRLPFIVRLQNYASQG
jgi:predicted nucleic acid-binding protein